MSKVAIYVLIDPTTNAHRYVGKTASSVEHRLKGHYRSVRLQSRTHLCNWLRKLARQGLRPKYKILEWVDSSSWQESERQWISKKRKAGCDLTNSTDGGEGWSAGRKHTKASKLKMKKSMAGMGLGRKLPKEQVDKMAHANRKRFESMDERRRISRIMKKAWARKRKQNGGILVGRIQSDETKQKLSRIHRLRWELGQITSEEMRQRAKASKKLRGIPRSKEVKRKISEALLGVTYPNRKKPSSFSKQHRRNLSLAQQRRWQHK